MNGPYDVLPLVETVTSALSATAAVVTVIILLYSLDTAIKQINRATHNQRRATASELWNTYLCRAVDYPVFAYPPSFPQKFDYEKMTIDGEREEFERYEWCVSMLLRATDEILLEFRNDDHRKRTALQNVRYHRKYLRYRSELKNREEDYLTLLSQELIGYIADLVETEIRQAAGSKLIELSQRPPRDTTAADRQAEQL